MSRSNLDMLMDLMFALDMFYKRGDELDDMKLLECYDAVNLELRSRKR